MLRRIGGGRRCEALLVWDEQRLSVLVAKVLRPDQARLPAARADLEHEAALLARLAHPVLVRAFGADLEGRFPHLVLEHLEGPTLAELIQGHGRLAVEQLLPLGLHVAAALHYLAVEDVLHLDVKPSNVVMGAPPRLIDLSVARTRAEAERVRAPLGTDAYMAPEQCLPDGGIGPPADVFGLAATLHHAVAGAPVRGRRAALPPAARGARPAPPPHAAGVGVAAARRPGPGPFRPPYGRGARHRPRAPRGLPTPQNDPGPPLTPENPPGVRPL